MSSVYDAAQAAYESLLPLSPDRCSIYDVTYPVDTSGGTTPTDGTALVTDLQVLYASAADQSGQLVGGALSEVTHKLYFVDSPITRGIKPNYAIVVAARANNPERRFEHPIILEGSMEVGVTVAATIKL